jgi:zinc protease
MISHKKMISLLLALGIVPAYANEVTQFQLDNGLTVMVKQDQRAPVVTSQVWYKVGASYEPDGVTGVSHMLEHMMFKGTQHLKPGELSKIIARLGGSENAFTSQDYTAYFQTIHKQHLKRMFELESERMQSLKLDDAEFQKERKVVLEERRMRVEDQPTSRLHERFEALAYDTNHDAQSGFGRIAEFLAILHLTDDCTRDCSDENSQGRKENNSKQCATDRPNNCALGCPGEFCAQNRRDIIK